MNLGIKYVKKIPLNPDTKESIELIDSLLNSDSLEIISYRQEFFEILHVLEDFLSKENIENKCLLKFSELSNWINNIQPYFSKEKKMLEIFSDRIRCKISENDTT